MWVCLRGWSQRGILRRKTRLVRAAHVLGSLTEQKGGIQQGSSIHLFASWSEYSVTSHLKCQWPPCFYFHDIPLNPRAQANLLSFHHISSSVFGHSIEESKYVEITVLWHKLCQQFTSSETSAPPPGNRPIAPQCQVPLQWLQPSEGSRDLGLTPVGLWEDDYLKMTSNYQVPIKTRKERRLPFQTAECAVTLNHIADTGLSYQSTHKER